MSDAAEAARSHAGPLEGSSVYREEALQFTPAGSRRRLTSDGGGMQVRWRDGTTRSCLVPVVGLLNHTGCAHVHRYSRLGASSGALRLQTLRACVPGEQLTLSYGPLSNAKLLLFYGFMLDDNPYDVLPVSLALDEDDPLCDAKAARLQAHGAWRVVGSGHG